MTASRVEPIAGWYVAFQESGCGLWFHRFLKPGFKHCYAFGWDQFQCCWVMVDPRIEGAYIRCFGDIGIEAAILAILGAGGTLIYARTERAAVRAPRLLLTCVTALEALLGLPNVCAFTPYRLYRILLARGATEIG